MSNPHDSVDFHQDELQFDEAEFTEPAHAVTTCTACQTPIADLYYEAGGKIVCDPCRNKIEAMFHGGSRLGRAFKALILGTIAAAAGAALYYAIIKITGWNIGLVAVFVGLMVGAAVKAGSASRGGWFYQLMALFLTYSAIVAMLIPVVLDAKQERQQKQNAQIEDIFKKAREQSRAELKKKNDKLDVVAPKTKEDQTKAVEATNAQAAKIAPSAPAADLKLSKANKPTTKAAKTKEAPEPAGKAENADADQADDEEEPEIANVNPNAGFNPAFTLLFVVIMILAAYSFPILSAIHAPISGFIFAFALWEAWKLNRKVRLVINGPFHLAADQPLHLAAEDLDDEQ